MPKPTLKIELIDGLQVIQCRKEDLDYESGKALSICIEDFRGQKGDPLRNTIYIEWYDEKIQIRAYNGGEDSMIPSSVGHGAIKIKPDPALSHAVYCPLEDLPKLIGSEDEAVQEIVAKRLKEKK